MLTGGGDCPGLNAVIRAVVRKGRSRFTETSSWDSAMVGADRSMEILHRWVFPMSEVSCLVAGPFLALVVRTHTTPLHGEHRVLQTVERLGLDALIVIGGEDYLGVATRLAAAGLPIIGVPKTIDNDLNGTDYTFGFDTAVTIATEATIASSQRPRATTGCS